MVRRAARDSPDLRLGFTYANAVPDDSDHFASVAYDKAPKYQVTGGLGMSATCGGRLHLNIKRCSDRLERALP
jgi:hypothetical protein